MISASCKVQDWLGAVMSLATVKGPSQTLSRVDCGRGKGGPAICFENFTSELLENCG